ncbi:lipid II flippase MurJ [Nocardia sp. NPDC004415]
MLGWLLVYAVISQIGVVITMRIAFDHGGVSVYTYAELLFQVPYGSAALIGTAVACSAFGLAPFALVMLQMRVFYAHNDTRTPAVLNLLMVTVKVGTLVLAATVLGDRAVIVMLSVAGSAAYVVGAVAGHVMLRRRHGLLGFSTVAVTVGRVVTATVLAGVAGVGALVAARLTIAVSATERLAAPAAGAVAAILVFAVAACVIGIPEFRAVRAMLRPA